MSQGSFVAYRCQNETRKRTDITLNIVFPEIVETEEQVKIWGASPVSLTFSVLCFTLIFLSILIFETASKEKHGIQNRTMLFEKLCLFAPIYLKIPNKRNLCQNIWLSALITLTNSIHIFKADIGLKFIFLIFFLNLLFWLKLVK